MEISPEILSKLQKLINLKEGAQAVGSQHEAENAAMRIQKYLLKYNLELSQLDFTGSKEKSKVNESDFCYKQECSKSESTWMISLTTVIARNSLCTTFCYEPITELRGRIVGEPHNIQIVTYTIAQLASKIRIAEKLSWKTYIGFEKRGTFRRGFFMGAVMGIQLKLKKQSEELNAGNKGMELMVINKGKELEEYMAEKYPQIKKVNMRSKSSNEGKMLGIAAGQKMDINSGLGNSKINEGYIA